MNVNLPPPGTYVVAVSGGVDSVVLLDVLARQTDPAWRLTVAHFDHGIRGDSAEDRKLVADLAASYGLPFVYDAAALGKGASEAAARRARYEFLHKVRRASGARAIVTAHHQDDLLETAILNLLRGSARKGLTALQDRHDLRRPFLTITKQELEDYARTHRLTWHEDSTNQDETYLRNYVRRRLLPRFSPNDRAKLLAIINDLAATNHSLDQALTRQLHLQSVGGRLDRDWFNHLPHDVAREVMAAWLRAHDLAGFDSKTLERLVVSAKTAAPGKRIDVRRGQVMHIGHDYLALARPER